MIESEKEIKTLTDTQKQFIKDNYQSMLYKDLAKALKTTERRVCNFIQHSGLRLSKVEFKRRKSIGQFRKEHLSWNKGLRGYMGANRTSFKKGNLPVNTLYDDAITIRKTTGTSYKWIRLVKAKWKELHRYLWEKEYGKVPKGFVLRFKDGNTMNVVLSNLELISRGEHLRRNQPADLYTNKRKYMLESDYYICNTLGIKDKKLQDELIKNHPEIINLKKAELKLSMELRNAS